MQYLVDHKWYVYVSMYHITQSEVAQSLRVHPQSEHSVRIPTWPTNPPIPPIGGMASNLPTRIKYWLAHLPATVCGSTGEVRIQIISTTLLEAECMANPNKDWSRHHFPYVPVYLTTSGSLEGQPV